MNLVLSLLVLKVFNCGIWLFWRVRLVMVLLLDLLDSGLVVEKLCQRKLLLILLMDGGS